MSYEKKPETGALFKNDRKEKETHPDYKGDALIDGKLYWVSSWVNESKSGTKYMSLAFKLKERQENGASAPAAEPAKGTDEPQKKDGGEFDDDIPFAFAIAVPVLGALAAASHFWSAAGYVV